MASIELILLRLLRRLVLHYSRGDHRTLSLLMTLLLTIATFIHDNPWVRLVLIIGRWLRRCSGGGLEGIAKKNEGGVETIPFLAWDLSYISSTNISLAIKSIEGSMLQCKIVPCNAWFVPNWCLSWFVSSWCSLIEGVINKIYNL